jgi:hypothetical protein
MHMDENINNFLKFRTHIQDLKKKKKTKRPLFPPGSGWDEAVGMGGPFVPCAERLSRHK